MTTVTIDEDCLRNVEKLQSLLRLQFNSLSGENITRGIAVNYAVSQQLSAMMPSMMPVTAAYQSPRAVSYTMSSVGGQNSSNAQTTPNLGTGGWYPEYGTADNIEPGTGGRIKTPRTRKGGEKDASSVGTD